MIDCHRLRNQGPKAAKNRDSWGSNAAQSGHDGGVLKRLTGTVAERKIRD